MGNIDAGVLWKIKENGVVVQEHKNTLTSQGLTNFASAIGGGYLPPVYLVINSAGTTQNTTTLAGVSAIVVAANPTISGDTQVVLGAGLATQELLTFNTITGSGPYTINLASPTANGHSAGEFVLRQPNVNDTLAVVNEQQYDATNAPNQRLLASSGYSGSVGNYVTQFYMTGTQAVNVSFMSIGLSDSPIVGTGTLHNHAVMGYVHNTTVDIEIDGSLTIVNA